MKVDLSELSRHILLEYYDNNTKPFFDCLHKDVLWIGPAHGQIIRSKKLVLETFGNELHDLKFAVHNLSVTGISISKNCTEVLLTFLVDTFWSDGSCNRVEQRITLTWEIKKDEPLIRICHISNAIDYDNRDTIYPVHYIETHKQMTLYKEKENKLSFKGLKGSTLYTSLSEILYMESNGVHTIIHTISQNFECNERLSVIAERMKESLVRSHSSYLVNPLHVISIERFFVTMRDGKKLPVPEKKYTKIKAELLKK